MHKKTGIQAKVKAAPEQGEGVFTAYASTFHREADTYGDIIAPGAFKDSIKQWENGKVIPVLWSHEVFDPFSDIGTVIAAEEDDHGLKITGQLDLDNEKAAQVFRLVKGGRINRMSFGFQITDSAQIKLDNGTQVRELRGIDLSEVSLVRFPANDHAEVISAKHAEETDPLTRNYQQAKAKWDYWEKLAESDHDFTAQDIHDWDVDRSRFYLAERALKEKQPEQETAPLPEPKKDKNTMNLKERYEAAKEAEHEAKNALRRDQTEANLVDYEEAVKETQRLQDMVARAKETTAMLEALDAGDDVSALNEGLSHKGNIQVLSSRASKGQRFANAVQHALEEKGIGSSELGNLASLNVPYNAPIVTDPKKAFSLENLARRVLVNAGSGQYFTQTLRDNQATSVPRGGLKPVSRYQMEARNWELATVAHLSEPIARQWMEDSDSFSQFISSEMAYGLSEGIDQFILNGGVSENGNEITGLLNTEGIEEIAYRVDPLRSIRRALGSLDLEGISATGIVMHPTDWEELELLADQDGRTLLAPNGFSASRQLWGTTVTLSASIPEGQAVVADWNSIYLLSRGGAQMRVTEVGVRTDPTPEEGVSVMADLFAHNQIMFRFETRVGLTLLSLPSIRKVELAKP